MRRSIGLLIAVVGSLTLVLTSSVTAEEAAPAAAESAPPADGEMATVVGVIDGDTIRVRLADGSLEPVRYIGIDTPEVGGERGSEPEPHSRRAALANAAYVEGREVVLESDVSDRDRFDRLLRYVWVETDDGWVMVNERLVALGLAEARAYEPDTRNHERFVAAQERAVVGGRGMHDPDAVDRALVGAEAMAYLFMDAYDARDVATLRRLMTSEVVYVLPGPERYRGKREVMDRFRAEWAELDPVTSIRSSIAQPSVAMLELTIVTRGSADGGPVESDAPDATPLAGESIEAVAVQRWPDDRLAHYRIYRDE